MAFEITIPRLGWSMEEGIFAGWQKKDGDLISPGDVLFELEGEKALQEIEAIDEGMLAMLPDGPQPGMVLKVGTIVGYLLADGESLPVAAGTPAAQSATSQVAAESDNFSAAAAPSVRRLARQLSVNLGAIQGSGSGGRITEGDVTSAAACGSATESVSAVFATGAESAVATPRARRAAKTLNLNLSNIVGSGRGGRIRERDVLQSSKSSASSVSGSQRMLISGRRKVIAERLSDSARQTVPVTITTRANANNLVGLRAQFKSAGQNPVPAIHDIVARLVADTLSQHLTLGGRWDGDAVIFPDPGQIHIGLAVDTPNGLLVPVLRNVSARSLLSVAEESARIIQKARSGRLSGAEMQGAVFTISNLGGYGIDAFTPVINLPETAILGLGAIRSEPVVKDDGKIVASTIMTLSLTFDHRVIDGAPAAKFLQSLVTAIENPAARLIAMGS